MSYNVVDALDSAVFQWQRTIDLDAGSGRSDNRWPTISWANYNDGVFYVAWEGRNDTTNRREIIVRRLESGPFTRFSSCVSARDYVQPTLRGLGSSTGNVLLVWRASDNAVHAAWLSAATGTWSPFVTGIFTNDAPTATGYADGVSGKLAYISGIEAPYAVNITRLSPPPVIASQLRAAAWNLVSVPNAAADYHACVVFPTAISQVFSYVGQTGYVPQELLATGPGYMTKFPTTETSIRFPGAPINFLSLSVPGGWSFIGSLSQSIHVSQIGTSPAGNIISGPFELRAGGYQLSDSIRPGVGYWVKMGASGTVTMPAQPEGPPLVEEAETYDEFTIMDAAGYTQKMYVRNAGLTQFPYISTEMPPAPPDSAFTVSFATGDVIKTVHPDSGIVGIDIAIHEAEYPISLSWDLNPENGITYEGLGGGLAKVSALGLSGSTQFASLESGVIRLSATASPRAIPSGLPTEFALSCNYPNPFNPSTKFDISLPEPAAISLVIYDILGRRVEEIVSGNFGAGYHSEVWHATAVASGLYLAKFIARGEDGATLYSKTQKLLLTK